MSRIDDLTEQLLAGKPLDGKTRYHKMCNDLMATYVDEVNSDDMHYGRAMRLKKQLRTAVIYLNYRPTTTGMNPKEVPTEHLRYALQNPLFPSFLSPEQRARVDSPVKGIRAFCMDCQGNDTVGVRACAAVNCPFWPFRMGKNVFFGKLASSEAEITDEEVEQEEFDDADPSEI